MAHLAVFALLTLIMVGGNAGADELPNVAAPPVPTFEQRYLRLLDENQRLRADLDIALSRNDELKEQLLRVRNGLLLPAPSAPAHVVGTIDQTPHRFWWTWHDVAWTAISTIGGILVVCCLSGLVLLVFLRSAGQRAKAIDSPSAGLRMFDVTLRLNVTRPEGKKQIPKVRWASNVARRFSLFSFVRKSVGEGRPTSKEGQSGPESA